MTGTAGGESDLASGSNNLIWCLPLANSVPPRGSPSGFDHTKVKALDSALKAGLPFTSMLDSGPIGKLVLSFSKSSLISSNSSGFITFSKI